ncbi:tetratricopeptide repeat-containing sensor histidine kinase [Aequorivita viscosa]|uniref:Histidine kinase n=1 Tax=Aequorivita viscosa TaxID=797419 RepID=A0A1M6CM11_9FLAO|nr:tetratricopeptide repeat protein [Aequorivita viscosa]SDW38573.1 Tetratricopeptide repeat-containing protein [Aequorivita viscosa]SHI62046.1 Histidine kinase [Aequorivita viscosa]
MKLLVRLFLPICLFIAASCFSQTNVEKINDSIISVYKTDPQKSLAFLLKLNKNIANSKRYDKGLTTNNIAIIYRELGDFQNAKKLSQKALTITDDQKIKASAYNNIGAVNRSLGLYEEALENYLEALSIYEKSNDRKSENTVINNIGNVYSYLGMTDKALEYFNKAKENSVKLKDKKGQSEAFNNIAIIYANEGKLQQALDYFKFSLDVENDLNDKKGIAESANNVGVVFYYMQEIDSALYYIEQAVTIEKSIKNYTAISSSYNNIATILIENNRIEEAEKYIDSAYSIANNAKITADIEAALETYSNYFEAKNDLKSALAYQKKLIAFKDSTLTIETNNKVAELEIKYETEKKENQILQQRAQLAEKDLEVRRKNTLIYGSLGLALVLALLGYLFYSQQKLKNRQLQKESELKAALVKIETQNKLQEQRLRISRDLHDNIGAQLTFIISSIDNLKYGFTDISEKLGSKLSSISGFTQQTIYELRDTIWAMNKENITLEDLQARIANFIEHAKNASEQTDFSFTIDNSVTEAHDFSSVEGMNIYRIIQEAVNNALKYASADKIEVNILKVENQYRIEIIDNGIGFNQAAIDMGNGLNNMKKRAREIGGSIEITSNAGDGTRIVLILK